MYGVLTEVTPSGRVNMEAVMFEGCPDRYGRYEVMGGSFDRDQIMRKFDREMRRRYERVAPNFEPFLPSKTPDIEKVIFNDPATIVIWKDKTKTVVKCQEGDTYSRELGLAMCISKKYLGNKGNFNEVFKKWIPEEKVKETLVATDTEGNVIKCFEKDLGPEPEISVEKMRKDLYKHCSYVGDCDRCLLGEVNTACDFTNKTKAGDYVISDEDIREYYKMVFDEED